jgi:steroid delta-isomerase-like uncharacterized protein
MNLAWAKEWVGNWSPEGAEKVAASYADDAMFHDYPTDHIIRGKDIQKMWLGMKRPDAGKHTFVVTGYIGTPDAGVVQWTWDIDHVTDFLGLPAKGKHTSTAGASVLIFKNGKIQEQHEYWDLGSMM